MVRFWIFQGLGYYNETFSFTKSHPNIRVKREFVKQVNDNACVHNTHPSCMAYRDVMQFGCLLFHDRKSWYSGLNLYSQL